MNLIIWLLTVAQRAQSASQLEIVRPDFFEAIQTYYTVRRRCHMPLPAQ